MERITTLIKKRTARRDGEDPRRAPQVEQFAVCLGQLGVRSYSANKLLLRLQSPSVQIY